jgi:hypothetical protein
VRARARARARARVRACRIPASSRVITRSSLHVKPAEPSGTSTTTTILRGGVGACSCASSCASFGSGGGLSAGVVALGGCCGWPFGAVSTASCISAPCSAGARLPAACSELIIIAPGSQRSFPNGAGQAFERLARLDTQVQNTAVLK